MKTWVLLAGAPATGKSTLASLLEHRLSATTLNKDRIRDVLFPGSLTDYTREQDDLCMRAIAEAAAYLTMHSSLDFIFVDGRAFSRHEQIDEVISAAERAGAAWRIVQLSCADEVAADRLGRRDADHPARNRDMALYRQVKQTFEPILYPKLEIDTTHGVEMKLDEVREYLIGAGL